MADREPDARSPPGARMDPASPAAAAARAAGGAAAGAASGSGSVGPVPARIMGTTLEGAFVQPRALSAAEAAAAAAATPYAWAAGAAPPPGRWFLCPVPTLLGVPLALTRLQPPGRGVPLQQDCVAYRMMIDPETGFAPPAFQGDPGVLLVARTDGGDFAPSDWSRLDDYVFNLLDAFCEPGAAARARLQVRLSPAAFASYCRLQAPARPTARRAEKEEEQGGGGSGGDARAPAGAGGSGRDSDFACNLATAFPSVDRATGRGAGPAEAGRAAGRSGQGDEPASSVGPGAGLVGRRVVLQNLVGRPELNGRVGLCGPALGGTGRHCVVLDCGEEDPLAIRAANLRLCTPAEEAEAAEERRLDDLTRAAWRAEQGLGGPSVEELLRAGAAGAAGAASARPAHGGAGERPASSSAGSRPAPRATAQGPTGPDACGPAPGRAPPGPTGAADPLRNDTTRAMEQLLARRWDAPVSLQAVGHMTAEEQVQLMFGGRRDDDVDDDEDDVE